MNGKEPVMQMVIASTPDIKADLRKNRKPILFVLGALALYIFASGIVYSFAESVGYLRSIYFTVINVTTVGFGDIYPLTHFGKVIASCNAFVGLITFGVLVATVTMALQPREFSGEVTQLKSPNPDVVEPPERTLKPEEELIEGLNKLFRGIGNFSTLSELENREVNESNVRGDNQRVHVEVTVRDHRLGRWKHIHIDVTVRKDA
jgi:hypothetical protein